VLLVDQQPDPKVRYHVMKLLCEFVAIEADVYNRTKYAAPDWLGVIVQALKFEALLPINQA